MSWDIIFNYDCLPSIVLALFSSLLFSKTAAPIVGCNPQPISIITITTGAMIVIQPPANS